ncbi:MAG: hypothetical protein ACE5OR_02130 [bacterium]
MADSLDVQKTPIDVTTYLLKRGEIGDVFPNAKIFIVIDGSFASP